MLQPLAGPCPPMVARPAQGRQTKENHSVTIGEQSPTSGHGSSTFGSLVTSSLMKCRPPVESKAQPQGMSTLDVRISPRLHKVELQTKPKKHKKTNNNTRAQVVDVSCRLPLEFYLSRLLSSAWRTPNHTKLVAWNGAAIMIHS